ncbi:hypothetical protein BDZ45DRAFT_481556 [Acephala macrosclerotiorum]|nr:hypothetical protein BDZ45DRAFT_481556 [Acephala macrosclerotiorum]
MAPAYKKCCVCGETPRSPFGVECTVCMSAHYCSKHCAEKDHLHVQLCDKFILFLKTRPYPTVESNNTRKDAKLAILLSKDSTAPQLIWVWARRSLDKDRGIIEQATVCKDIVNKLNVDTPVTLDFVQNGHHLRVFVVSIEEVRTRRPQQQMLADYWSRIY